MTVVQTRTPGSSLLAAPTNPKEEVLEIPLEDIVADYAWNSRSQANVLSEDPEGDGGGLSALAAGMRAVGQEEPITVRPNREKKGPKRNHLKNESSYAPWELVHGFRRFEAAKKNNADPKWVEHYAKEGRPVILNVKNGCILARIKDLDERQAILKNFRENVGRIQLEPPEMLTGIARLLRSPVSMKISEIAENQSLSLPTVTRYANMAVGLDPSIIQHWKFGGAFEEVTVPKRVSLEEMEVISRLPRGEQVSAYKDVLLGRAAKANVKTWFQVAEKSAARAGAYLAKLQKAGVITISSKPWEECLEVVMRVPGAAKEKAREKLAKILSEAFAEELYVDETMRHQEERKERAVSAPTKGGK